MRAALVAVEPSHPCAQEPIEVNMRLLALLTNSVFDPVFFADNANSLYAILSHICRALKNGGFV